MHDWKTKHKKRDLAIPEHRERLINTIEKDLLQDDDVLGVFYGGSIGNQNTDLYSDIDLRIVIKDEKFEAYRSNKKQLAKSWGNVLYFEESPGWNAFCAAHYDTFVKVDIFCYKVEDIQPSIWQKNIKLVKDPNGFLKEILEKSNLMSYSPTLQEVEIWRTKFFAHAHEVYRRVMRNEIYYTLHSLDRLRQSVVEAWYMEMGIQPNTSCDWSKIEGSRSKLSVKQLLLLEQWHSSRHPDEIFKVLENIISEFKEVHKRLCHKLQMPEDSEWVEDILNMIL